jgi:hypothetical protein
MPLGKLVTRQIAGIAEKSIQAYLHSPSKLQEKPAEKANHGPAATIIALDHPQDQRVDEPPHQNKVKPRLPRNHHQEPHSVAAEH